MIIKANDRIFIQTRNILNVEDDPIQDRIIIYYNTSTNHVIAHGTYQGQDRLDVLVSLKRATYHKEG